MPHLGSTLLGTAAIAGLLAVLALAPLSAEPGDDPQLERDLVTDAGAPWDRLAGAAALSAVPPLQPLGAVAEDLSGFLPPVGTIDPKLESGLSQLVADARSGGDLQRLAMHLGIPLLNDGLTVIVETDPSDADNVRRAVSDLGLEVQGAYEGWVQVRATVDRLLLLTQISAVKFVRRPMQLVGQGITTEAIARVGVQPWQEAGFRGQGARVAIIDQGFFGYKARIAFGELPKNVITRSFVSGLEDVDRRTRHGTACAELIYDIAPDAQLYLVTIGTEVELADAVIWLINENVQVISFSMGAPAAPNDGTAPLDRVVDRAHAAGLLWLNASGNYGAGHWSGTFQDDGEGWHGFAPGQRLFPLEIGADEQALFLLVWDDWPVSNQDFAIYLFWRSIDGSLQLMAYSDSAQTGQQPPGEVMTAFGPPRGTYYVAIRRQQASRPVRFHLYSLAQDLKGGVPEGSAVSPSTARGAVAVGATNGFDQVQAYSSRGPSGDGRMKPDLVAPDAVSTESFGFQGFPGTSAAAPHTAGLAAVLLSAYSWMRGPDLLYFLQQNALPLGPERRSNVWGAGRVQLGALASVPPTSPTLTPTPTKTPAGTATVTPTGTLTPSRTPTAVRTSTPTRPPTSPTATSTPAAAPTGVAWPSTTRYLPLIYRR